MYRRPNLKETPPPRRNKKIPDPTSENPRALRDEHNRVRYITVGFRVSAEQNEKINVWRLCGDVHAVRQKRAIEP